MAPIVLQWNQTVNIEVPQLAWPFIISRRHALCSSTDGIFLTSQQHSEGAPCPVASGPAGTIPHGVHESQYIWQNAEETAPRIHGSDPLIDGYTWVGVWCVVILLAGILFLLADRIFMHVVERWTLDLDAAWQATADLEYVAPITFHAVALTRWDEDDLTLCGEDDASIEWDEETISSNGEDEPPRQAGMDIERAAELETDQDRWHWRVSSATLPSEVFMEERGRRGRRSSSASSSYWA